METIYEEQKNIWGREFMNRGYDDDYNDIDWMQIAPQSPVKSEYSWFSVDEVMGDLEKELEAYQIRKEMRQERQLIGHFSDTHNPNFNVKQVMKQLNEDLEDYYERREDRQEEQMQRDYEKTFQRKLHFMRLDNSLHLLQEDLLKMQIHKEQKQEEAFRKHNFKCLRNKMNRLLTPVLKQQMLELKTEQQMQDHELVCRARRGQPFCIGKHGFYLDTENCNICQDAWDFCSYYLDYSPNIPTPPPFPEAVKLAEEILDEILQEQDQDCAHKIPIPPKLPPAGFMNAFKLKFIILGVGNLKSELRLARKRREKASGNKNHLRVNRQFGKASGEQKKEEEGWFNSWW